MQGTYEKNDISYRITQLVAGPALPPHEIGLGQQMLDIKLGRTSSTQLCSVVENL